MYTVFASAVGAVTLVLAVPAAAQAAPPVCPDASFTVEPGKVLQFPKPVCNDPEGNTYQVSSVSDPPHGAIGGTPDAGSYSPDAGFHGRDEFTYRVTDSANEVSLPATVRIWAGGDCPALSRRSIPGVRVVSDVQHIGAWLAEDFALPPRD